MRSFPKLLLIALLVFPRIASGQTSPQASPTLRVNGPTGQSIVLSAHDLETMPRESAKVVDEKGNHAIYEGVPVIEILRRAGAPTGNDLRGKQMTLYVLVTASDGYHAVFALAELDPGFTDRRVLMADRRNGKDLSAAEGPFRIVVPGEKRHARWVRNVISLSLKAAD